MVPARDNVLQDTDKDEYNGDDLAPALSQIDLGGSFRTSMDGSGLVTPPQSPTHHKIPRRSLVKPLPSVPTGNRDGNIHSSSDISARDVERKLGVDGVVDLGHTEDTIVHKRMAPAVTHETIKHDYHEIRHEERTRDIHEHHIHHRILPIKDVEVKPARHYIQNSFGQRTEVSEDQVPGRSPKLTRRVIEEVYKDLLPKNKSPSGPRQFSAREFSGSQGDDWDAVSPEGVKLSERWWVHPPTLENGGKESGQTVPFHLGSANPADDGFGT